MDLLILGCGYTGRRVAARFLASGARVIATTRHPAGLADLAARGACVVRTGELPERLAPGILVLQSVPPEGPANLLEPLRGVAARVVYLSSTVVYSRTTVVDENTPTDDSTARARARLQAEQAVSSGPWSWLILRPAAIYGPGRGVQESIRHGSHSLSRRYVSRIHVDDLALHAEAALLSNLAGAYPVADEEPCTSLEIAEHCARLLHVPLRGPEPGEHTRSPRFSSNRRVDGSAIRSALGIKLLYPSYRVGIPASL